MSRIGIPRALLYYQYYPMWQTFFAELGAEVVVSPPTTEAMLTSGSSRVVADTCLPVKIFLGHVLWLVDKCDSIFIPAIRSVRRNAYNCSKFLGLPDMTRAVIPESPLILEVEIDINRGKRRLYQAIYQIGRYCTPSPLKIRQAAMAALKTDTDYHRIMSGSNLTPPESIDRLSSAAVLESEGNDEQTPPRNTVALIGHPYLLYDDYINHRLIHRLNQAHVRVLTPEMLSHDEIETAKAGLKNRGYWTYEDEVVGAGKYYLESGVDGVIGIMAFGCGPDSVMMEVVHQQAIKRRETPFMSLTLDEHTAETGIATRLEAFLDMINRRKRRQVTVCA